MNRTHSLRHRLATTLLTILLAASVQGGDHHWSYADEGDPDHWGEVPGWETCRTGHEQSPIDLPLRPTPEDSGILLEYGTTPLNEHNNGHTVQLDVTSHNSIELDGHHYDLLQLHFHWPSEHTLGGEHFPMEMHLVHKDARGQLAVLGVFFREGKPNPALARMFMRLPREGERIRREDVDINLRELLPIDLTREHYSGSLTTPPCSEHVDWNVFTSPLEASRAEILAFKARFHHPTNRPIQPLWNRTVTLRGMRSASR